MMYVLTLQDEARPAAVCEICGDGSNQAVMFSCIQCNGYQHRYSLFLYPVFFSFHRGSGVNHSGKCTA